MDVWINEIYPMLIDLGIIAAANPHGNLICNEVKRAVVSCLGVSGRPIDRCGGWTSIYTIFNIAWYFTDDIFYQKFYECFHRLIVDIQFGFIFNYPWLFTENILVCLHCSEFFANMCVFKRHGDRYVFDVQIIDVANYVWTRFVVKYMCVPYACVSAIYHPDQLLGPDYRALPELDRSN